MDLSNFLHYRFIPFFFSLSDNPYNWFSHITRIKCKGSCKIWKFFDIWYTQLIIIKLPTFDNVHYIIHIYFVNMSAFMYGEEYYLHKQLPWNSTPVRELKTFHNKNQKLETDAFVCTYSYASCNMLYIMYIVLHI